MRSNGLSIPKDGCSLPCAMTPTWRRCRSRTSGSTRPLGRLLNSAGAIAGRVWIAVVAAAVLGRQAKLETLVTRGRKRGLAAVLGFQHRSTAPNLWPRASRGARLDAFERLPPRVDEPETAAFIARQIGEREALREEIGISTAEHGNRFDIHPTRRTEPVVMASEIQRLPSQAISASRGT